MMNKSMAKKIALITGSTDGIGLHTAYKLALTNDYKVLIHGRSQERLTKAKEFIMKKVPNAEIDMYLYDLINLEGSKALANDILSKYDQLDILINNAGVFQQSKIITNDNLESTFAINCCSTFILNILLLPLLRKTNGSRILNVSSISQSDIGTMDLNNMQFEKGGFTSYDSYSLSKLVVAMISHELALRISPTDSLVLSCDPGTVNTKMLLAGWGRCGIDIEDANDEYYLTTKSFDPNDHGKYFVHSRISTGSKDVYDDKKRELLWNQLEKICNVKL